MRDSEEALDRLLSLRGGAWLTNEPQAIVLSHAGRLLSAAREPRREAPVSRARGLHGIPSRARQRYRAENAKWGAYT